MGCCCEPTQKQMQDYQVSRAPVRYACMFHLTKCCFMYPSASCVVTSTLATSTWEDMNIFTCHKSICKCFGSWVQDCPVLVLFRVLQLAEHRQHTVSISPALGRTMTFMVRRLKFHSHGALLGADDVDAALIAVPPYPLPTALYRVSTRAPYKNSKLHEKMCRNSIFSPRGDCYARWCFRVRASAFCCSLHGSFQRSCSPSLKNFIPLLLSHASLTNTMLHVDTVSGGDRKQYTRHNFMISHFCY